MIRGDNSTATMEVLTGLLDHELVAKYGNRFRFAAYDKPGHYMDYVITPGLSYSSGGRGTVHHIAFLTVDEKSQTAVR